MTLMLLVGSTLALTLLIVHSWRTRGRNVTLGFFGLGLLFGILRGNTVWLIMQSLGGPSAIKPYIPQGGLLPEIGHDSLQVAAGWVFSLYLAWTVAEAILRRLPRLTGRVFMVAALSVLFMCAICYCMETTAVSVGWWYWTLPTKTTLFGNVNTPGMWAWFSVVPDFLMPFLVIACSTSRSRLRWLWLAAFPLHMSSHLLYTRVDYAGLNHHAMLLLVVVLAFFSRLRLDAGKPDTPPDGAGPATKALPGIALAVFLAVVVVANLLAGAPRNLLTALPLLMLCLLAWRRLPVWMVAVLSLLALSGWFCVGFRALYACVPLAVYAYLALASAQGEKLWLRAAPVGLALALSAVVVVQLQSESVRATGYIDAWREGDRLALAGSADAAIDAYARSDALRPTDVVVYCRAVREMTRMKGVPNEVGAPLLAHRMPRLEAEFRNIIARDEEWLAPREDLATLYLLEGNVSGACEQYRLMYRLRPADTEVMAMLGYLLLREGKLAEAETVCEKAATLKEPPVEALVNLGVIRLHEGRRQDARDLWKRALRLEAGNAIAQLNLQRSDTEDAGAGVDMRYLARKRAVSASGWANDMAAYMKGLSDEAKLRLLIESVQFDPLFVRAHLNLVRLYSPTQKTTHDAARALWHAHRAVALARTTPGKEALAEALFFLGYTLLADGKPEQARAALEEGKPLATGAWRAKFDEILKQLEAPALSAPAPDNGNSP